MSFNNKRSKPLAPIHLNKTPFREFLQQHAKVINLARLAWVEPVLGLHHGCLWSAEYSYQGEHTLQYLREFSAKFDRLTNLQTINIFSNKLDRITIYANYTEHDYAPEKNILSPKQRASNSYIYWGSSEWKLNQIEKKEGLGFVKAETLFSKSSAALVEPSHQDKQPDKSTDVAGPTMQDGQKPVLPKKPITIIEPSLLNRQILPLSVSYFLNLVQQRANIVNHGQLIWVEPVLSLYHSSLWSTEYSYQGEHTLQYLIEFSAKFEYLTDLRTVNIFSNKFDRITIHAIIHSCYYSPKKDTEDVAKNESNKQRRRRERKLKRQEKTALGLGFVKGETFPKLAPAVVEPTKPQEQPNKSTIAEPTMIDKQVLPKKPTVTEPSLVDRQKLVVRLTETLPGHVNMRLKENSEEIAKNQSNRQLRSQRRSREWKLKQEEKTALGLGLVKDKTFPKLVPAVVEPTKPDGQPKSTIAEPTMPDKQVLPTKPNVTEPSLVDGQKLPFSNSKPPVVRLTVPGYVKMRLRDPYIYKLVRNYLGYLRKAPDGQIFEGESRVTSEIKIQNEGLPLGSELEKLFYEFLIE